METKRGEVSIISRNEAQAAGLTRYATGEACRAGHVAERTVSNRVCVACAAEHAKARYRKRLQDDPEALHAALSASVRRHYRKNRSAILEAKKAHYRDNAEAIKQRARNYRARKAAEKAATINQ
jgi:hypothetical protein